MSGYNLGVEDYTKQNSSKILKKNNFLYNCNISNIFKRIFHNYIRYRLA